MKYTQSCGRNVTKMLKEARNTFYKVTKHTHKPIDADTLAVVHTCNGCNNIVDEGL